MRIRSLKPEFWSHPVMCQQSAEVRLLAIGLLNLADDEGYFVAHPAIIRGSLMPFEESTRKIPKLLERLAAIGYITLKEQPDGICLGHVTNFLKHQRINRPSKSRLKGSLTESSLNPHGALTHNSLGEQGSGNREEEQGSEQGGEGAAGAARPPAAPDSEPEPPAQKKEGGRGAPANVEEALAYAASYSKGNTEMLVIEDAWVRDWHDERESVGWMKVSGGVQVPITDWRADLLRWCRRDARFPRQSAPAKKEEGRSAVPMEAGAPDRYAEAWLELYGTELPAWGMLGEGERSEVRRWISTNRQGGGL